MKKRLAKPGNRIARKPSWIGDIENQKQWTARFAEKLREIEKSDAMISTILAHEHVLLHSAAQIRLYTDLSVTAYFYQERQRRGRKQVGRLNTAIRGMSEACELYTEFGNLTAASQVQHLRDDLSAILQRSKQAYSNKRHGRDRDHTILARLHGFLEEHVGLVTNATLATLANKAMEVDGHASSGSVTEESVRKNLNAFREHNPTMVTLLAGEKRLEVVGIKTAKNR